MPYASARDLPSYLELAEGIQSMKMLRFLMPRKERPNLRELESQLNELVDTVDAFYEVLGGRNWIFHDALSVPDMRELVGNAEDVDTAEQNLIAWYTEPGRLAHMAMGLTGLDAMRKRQRLIGLALADYEAGRFHGTIHVLLSVMDGFVNEFEAVRQGLHARDPEDLQAWDSVVGHHMGLEHAHQSFRRRFGTTKDEPVYDLFRNGIVHGTLINFDNVVVATKAWNYLFAVADWARSTLKRDTPPPPQTSWKELFQQLAENDRRKKANEAFAPSTLQLGDAGFEEQSVLAEVRDFLDMWMQRNYGGMAGVVTATIADAYGRRFPAEIKEQYGSLVLSSFEVSQLSYEAAAVCTVRASLMVNEARRTATMRWLHEDDKGDPIAYSLDGRWRLYVWGPVAFLDA